MPTTIFQPTSLTNQNRWLVKRIDFYFQIMIWSDYSGDSPQLYSVADHYSFPDFLFSLLLHLFRFIFLLPLPLSLSSLLSSLPSLQGFANMDNTYIGHQIGKIWLTTNVDVMVMVIRVTLDKNAMKVQNNLGHSHPAQLKIVHQSSFFRSPNILP